jgi:hypothetical protein
MEDHLMHKPAARIARFLEAMLLASLFGLCLPAQAQNAVPPPGATSAGDGTFLLTIFLKHDESKTLPQINQQLKEQGYFRQFPPPGVEVVSWYVMMGIGQVVTLRVPADRLREVNRAIESTAWGGYRTEFYPTYDYKAAAQKLRDEMNK